MGNTSITHTHTHTHKHTNTKKAVLICSETTGEG